MANPEQTKPKPLYEVDLTRSMEIQRAISVLISEEPFYASLVQSCKFTWNDTVKTAGVRVNNKAEVELVVSRKFWDKMFGYWGIGLLKHEMLHLVHEHLTRGKNLEHQIANLAMDIAINQYIDLTWLPEGGFLHTGPHLPKGPRSPEDLKNIELFKKMKLKPLERFEYYYSELMKMKDKLGGSGPMDNHDWQKEGQGEPGEGEDQDGSGDSTVSDEVRKIAIDNVLQRAVEETEARFPGRVPMHVKQALNERFQPAKVNWKKELRAYVGRFLSASLEGTRTRLNRRLGLAAPGWRKTFAPRIMIAVDASGSVSDAMYVAFMSEIRELLKGYNDKVELFFFDWEVCETKLNIDKLHKIPDRPAYGGTNFQAAVDYAAKQKPDLLVFLTDGQDNLKNKPHFPILWVVYGGYKNPSLPGKVINVDESDFKKK
jgi:predicted metal-dependent peptidase